MLNRIIKVAIIGAGGVSDSHVDGWKKCPDADIIAVVDIDQEQAQAKIDKWGIQAEVYQSLEELVSCNRPDLVDICTPEHVHKLVGLQAIEAGIPVFSEKMLAATLEDGFAMKTAAGNKGVWTAINYNYHYFPCLTLLKQISTERKQDPIREVYVQTHSFCFHHVLEALLWIFGTPASVLADGQDRDWPPALEAQFKIADNLLYIPSNSFSAKMKYTEGLIIQLNASMYQSLEALPFSYTCLFESGQVLQATELDWANDMVGKVYWLPKGDNLISEQQYQDQSNLIGFRASIAQTAKQFIKGEEAPSTWEDGWNTMVVDHAMYLSGVNGTVMNVPELKSQLEGMLGAVTHE